MSRSPFAGERVESPNSPEKKMLRDASLLSDMWDSLGQQQTAVELQHTRAYPPRSPKNLHAVAKDTFVVDYLRKNNLMEGRVNVLENIELRDYILEELIPPKQKLAPMQPVQSLKWIGFEPRFDPKEYYMDHEGAHECFVYLEVNNLNAVTTTDNTFGIDVQMQVSWKPYVDEICRIIETAVEKDSHFVDPEVVNFRPYLQAYNTKDITWDSGWDKKFQLFYDTKKKCFLLKQHRQIIATGEECFELHNFPLDVQDVCLTICATPVTPKTANHVIKLLPEDPTCLAMRMGYLQEFTMHNRAIVEFVESNPSDANDGICKWDLVKVRFKVYRQWESYFFRLCFIISLVTLSGCLGFTMDLEDDFPDICAYMGTCLLTVVAFMFVVTTKLPEIPYLTFLDKFVISMLSLVVVQMSSLGYVAITGQTSSEFSTMMLYFSAGIWLLLHLYFAVNGFFKRRQELKKLTMNGQELEKVRLLQESVWESSGKWSDKEKFVLTRDGFYAGKNYYAKF